jgi:hypothetical protein
LIAQASLVARGLCRLARHFFFCPYLLARRLSLQPLPERIRLLCSSRNRKEKAFIASCHRYLQPDRLARPQTRRPVSGHQASIGFETPLIPI